MDFRCFCLFRAVKLAAYTSTPFHIHSGVLQGRMLGPLLYLLRTSDLPTSRETTLGKFANDTTIFPTHEGPMIASPNPQEHLHIIQKWLKKWKVKFNESKSFYITFILRKGHCAAVNIHRTIVPQTEVLKYTRLQLNCTLNWKDQIVKKKETNHIKNKRSQIFDRKKFPSTCRK
jgi:hypothetical protein